MKKATGRSRIVTYDDDEDVAYLEEDPLPQKKGGSASKRKQTRSDSESDGEVHKKQTKLNDGSIAKSKSGSSGSKEKRSALPVSKKQTPRKTTPGSPKAQQVATYRAFQNREPPQALGTKEIPQGQENCLEGFTFVLTGVLDSIDRDEAKNLIQRLGGKVTTSLSKSTSYLVAGRDCGPAKLNKAKEFGTTVLDDDGLFDLIRRMPGKKSKYEIAAAKEAAAAQKQNAKPAQKSQSFTAFGSAQTSSFTPASSSLTTSQSFDDRRWAVSSKSKSEPEPQLWVDKYKPTSVKQIIGQQGDKSNAKKLLHWMENWRANYDKKPAFGARANDTGAGFKAALLSGPPGIGKTTTAQLVCQELGFSYVEMNASDNRSKRSMQEDVAVALGSRTLVDFFNDDKGNTNSDKASWKHCLIMDEVCGMAGNEDRGGIQELIQLIKKSKIPIICICNDRNLPKMRSLSNYCFDLRFQRPRVEQIKGAVMSMAFKEGLKIPPSALNDIIVAANQDIRQIIHNLAMWSVKDKNLTYEQLKADADNARKDLRVGAFDICRKVFAGGEETANMTLNDKIDLFFNDYSIVPLFVQENYLSVTPYASRGSVQNHLRRLSAASDSIAWGDVVDGMIRRAQNWNLLPLQAVFSSVVPGDTMRGGMGGMIQFPTWLGKNSSSNKSNRLTQELCCHMALSTSGNKNSLNMDYLPYMRWMLSVPLATEGTSAVDSVVASLDAYDLSREDFDSIMELTTWSTSDKKFEKIDSKVKAAFTRAYNKTAHLKPYATGVMSKKKRRAAGDFDEMEGLEDEFDAAGDEGTANNGEESEEEDIANDTMIKQKKNAKALAKIKQLNDIELGEQPGPSGSGSQKAKKPASPKKAPPAPAPAAAVPNRNSSDNKSSAAKNEPQKKSPSKSDSSSSSSGKSTTAKNEPVKKSPSKSSSDVKENSSSKLASKSPKASESKKSVDNISSPGAGSQKQTSKTSGGDKKASPGRKGTRVENMMEIDDDDDAFDQKASTKSKQADASDDVKKKPGKGKDTSQSKSKTEVKTPQSKNILSFFKPKS